MKLGSLFRISRMSWVACSFLNPINTKNSINPLPPLFHVVTKLKVPNLQLLMLPRKKF